ncbi:NADP-dependent oxidoreductase domain-containing protein [Mycena olivaceomarginata]|nr:NADP-dependent oxidoreductase domain-containing protein [Mycena olivaceomarginata]
MAKTSRIPLVFGAAAWGDKDVLSARVNDKTAGQELVDVFVKAGGKTIDTSNLYANGTSEKFVSQLDLKEAHVDTKIFPLQPGAHSPENLRGAVKASVQALAPHKINVLFLHAPDRTVPFEDIAREINELHKEGLIREFGLSNFFSWEVAEFHFIAEKNGWIRPTVYQCVYNAFERQAEAELLPLLKKFGIRFYGYSPLAGSILAGKDLVVAATDGSRFDPKASEFIAQYYNARYPGLIPAVHELRDEAAKHGLTLPQVAFRWLQHHSQFDSSNGDAIVFGANSLGQLQTTLEWNEEGPLPEDIVKLVDALYLKNKGLLWHYSGVP